MAANIPRTAPALNVGTPNWPAENRVTILQFTLIMINPTKTGSYVWFNTVDNTNKWKQYHMYIGVHESFRQKYIKEYFKTTGKLNEYKSEGFEIPLTGLTTPDWRLSLL